jgi:hypothetical protein
MATTGNYISQSMDAGADLSARQFTFVTLDNTGRIVNTAANAKADGVLLTNPTLGKAGVVAVVGRVKVVADAAIAAGAEIQVGPNGRAITATSTNIRVGRAVEAASAQNQIITIDFTPGGNAA